MRIHVGVTIVLGIVLSGLSLPHRTLAEVPPVDANAPRIDLIVRDSYLPGVPVLVRVQVAGPDGAVDRDVWDANAVLSVSGNSVVDLSTDRVALRNGLGSGLVTFTGGGDFDLTVSVGDLAKTVRLPSRAAISQSLRASRLR